jgi:hypothetical protein
MNEERLQRLYTIQRHNVYIIRIQEEDEIEKWPESMKKNV